LRRPTPPGGAHREADVVGHRRRGTEPWFGPLHADAVDDPPRTAPVDAPDPADDLRIRLRRPAPTGPRSRDPAPDLTGRGGSADDGRGAPDPQPSPAPGRRHRSRTGGET